MKVSCGCNRGRRVTAKSGEDDVGAESLAAFRPDGGGEPSPTLEARKWEKWVSEARIGSATGGTVERLAAILVSQGGCRPRHSLLVDAGQRCAMAEMGRCA